MLYPPLLKQYNLTPPSRDLLCNNGNKTNPSNVTSHSIMFGEPTPQQIKIQIPKFIQQSKIYIQLSNYMERRPCWLKNVLLAQLKQDNFTSFTQWQFKNALKYLSYTYRNGPWKNTYCSFGYNPEKTYKSVIYQQITVKLKSKQADDYEDIDVFRQEIYDPTFKDQSKGCGRSYQLCDINDQNIKEIINGRLLIQDSKCTKEYGWLSKSQHNNVMSIMRSHVKHD